MRLTRALLPVIFLVVMLQANHAAPMPGFGGDVVVAVTKVAKVLNPFALVKKAWNVLPHLEDIDANELMTFFTKAVEALKLLQELKAKWDEIKTAQDKVTKKKKKPTKKPKAADADKVVVDDPDQVESVEDLEEALDDEQYEKFAEVKGAVHKVLQKKPMTTADTRAAARNAKVLSEQLRSQVAMEKEDLMDAQYDQTEEAQPARGNLRSAGRRTQQYQDEEEEEESASYDDMYVQPRASRGNVADFDQPMPSRAAKGKSRYVDENEDIDWPSVPRSAPVAKKPVAKQAKRQPASVFA